MVKEGMKVDKMVPMRPFSFFDLEQLGVLYVP